MSQYTSYIIIVGVALLAAIYGQYSKRDKIHCTFHGSDKTIKSKWVKNDAKYIVHDGGLYFILPDGAASIWWSAGMNFILPFWGKHADYRFDSPFPMNPDTFEYTAGSPEALLALTKEKDIRDYNRANEIVSKGKESKLQQYRPLIMLAGFAILGYLVYTIMKKQDSIGLALNVLQQMMMNK